MYDPPSDVRSDGDDEHEQHAYGHEPVESLVPLPAIATSNSLQVHDQPLPPHPRINSFSAEPFVVCAHNIHRLVLAALVVCSKYCDDACLTNAAYAQLGGVSLRELNVLEMELLNMLQWSVHIEQRRLIEAYTGLNHPQTHVACTSKDGNNAFKHALGPQLHEEVERMERVEREEADQHSASMELPLCRLSIPDLHDVAIDSDSTHHTDASTPNPEHDGRAHGFDVFSTHPSPSVKRMKLNADADASVRTDVAVTSPSPSPSPTPSLGELEPTIDSHQDKVCEPFHPSSTVTGHGRDSNIPLPSLSSSSCTDRIA